MARRRRGLAPPTPGLDPELEFLELTQVVHGQEEGNPRDLLRLRIRREARAILGRGGSPERQLARLWHVVDWFGVRAEAERHLARIEQRDRKPSIEIPRRMLAHRGRGEQ